MQSEADRWGFYNRVVEPDQLAEQAATLAQSLAEGPTFAHAMTKKALHQEWNMGDRRGDRGRSANAGDLHADRRLRARLSGVREPLDSRLHRGIA